MKKSIQLGSFALVAVSLLAQGPPPDGRRGFGPGFGPGIRFAGPGSRTPVTGAPYSAVQTTQFQQVLAGGNTISRQEQTKVYRDLQGRVRMEHTRTGSDGQARTVVTIFDPVANMSHVLDPAAKTALSTALPGQRQGVHTDQRSHTPPAGGTSAQIQKQDLGQQMVNGVQATGTRVTETIPAAAIGNAQAIQIVRETWVSVDLKVPVQITTSDPRFGNSSMQLANIVKAEPDASLFVVPADFTASTKAAGAHMQGRRPQQ